MLKTIKSWFAWEDVRDSGVWLYRENTITRNREAIKISGAHQPLDFDWLQDAPSGKFRTDPPLFPPPAPQKRGSPGNRPLPPSNNNERQWQPTHRHNKGGKYRILHGGILEADLTPVVIYQALDGTIWVRPSAEFHDGRFTKIED